MTYLLLLSPAANRVYAGEAASLTVAELEVCTGLIPSPTTLAGIDYLAFDADELSVEALSAVAQSSARLALFERAGDLLRPVELPAVDVLDDDFVTIPKYQGKTNEQFTRLLLNVARAAASASCSSDPSRGSARVSFASDPSRGSARASFASDPPRGSDEHRIDATTRTPPPTVGGSPGAAAKKPLTVLDPLCGRGTTLSVAWTLGMNAAGVEADAKSFEAMAAFWKTWLRRKRLKHTADITPVRREGKSIGRRFDATVRVPDLTGELTATVFTGDTRDSANLFGKKKKFELIVADAPYGVVHGSRTDVKGTAGKRDRSPAGLLAEAIGVWAGQLAPGGALGLSWNTLGLAREKLAAMAADAGLTVLDDGPWLRFAHRVDSSIHRDILVAQRPA